MFYFKKFAAKRNKIGLTNCLKSRVVLKQRNCLEMNFKRGGIFDENQSKMLENADITRQVIYIKSYQPAFKIEKECLNS
ncbi:hypothetical protein PB1_04695 [Bacillus methanolicus PB1]|uniref:Uncharacterized protein n=1 Tax=Bacillus methanolicus PB1 TaxID=997296 RepID=I3E6T2_BACMT|nr:hypothetical protein PB1_04695 [Bacillus methanolicus PB1]